MLSLKNLFQSLQKINLQQPEEKIIQAVKPLVKFYISHAKKWFDDRFYEIDEEQGFGSHLIAENPNHTLPVIITSWPQGRETSPHDHDTWAVIGCVKGVEENILWNRLDDRSNPYYAKIAPRQTITCKPGDIVTMKTHDIHSVVNPEKEVSISLHIYGKHFNFTNRHQFDPKTNAVKPFIVRQTEVQ